ncbi:MFS transporter [Longirhabdus pacifica]|uniref:MFS transporter n=1 Tax=Longirhabdus pacifica TaxID=2305227 RepID=UPI001008D60B|nr:MFS transporter [Longirhabdus pacifica]
MKSNTSKSHFTFLWSGQAIANYADVMIIMTLIFTIYDQTGSAALSGLVPLIRTLVVILSGLLAPLLLDRFPLTRLLSVSQLLQLLGYVVLSFYLIHLPQHENYFLLFLSYACICFLDGWTSPAKQALVPRLVPRTSLVKANSVVSVSDQIAQLAAWALGGILIVLIPISLLLTIMVSLYTISFILILFIKEPTNVEKLEGTENVDNDEAKRKSLPSIQSILEGWKAIFQHALLRKLMVMDMIEGIVGGVWIGALTLIYVQEQLGKAEVWWGFINTAYFVGAIVGGVFVGYIMKKLRLNLWSSMVVGAALFSGLVWVYAFSTQAWLAVFVTLFMGPAFQLRDISQTTLYQQSVNQQLYPKVISAKDTINTALMAISIALMTVIADLFGIQLVYMITAICSGISAIVGILSYQTFKPYLSPATHDVMQKQV